MYALSAFAPPPSCMYGQSCDCVILTPAYPSRPRYFFRGDKRAHAQELSYSPVRLCTIGVLGIARRERFACVGTVHAALGRRAGGRRALPSSKARLGSGAPGPPTGDLERVARDSRATSSTSRTTSGLTDQSFKELHLVLRPPGSTSSASSTSRSSSSRARRLTREIVFQASSTRRRPGQFRARLEGLSFRLRVRLHHARSRLRRIHPRLQVHQRAGDLSSRRIGEPRIGRVARARSRRLAASSAFYLDSQRLDHRARSRLLLRPRRASRKDFEGALPGPRLLRHLQLHAQRRRPARLPIGSISGYLVRRGLRRLRVEGALLRGGRKVLRLEVMG